MLFIWFFVFKSFEIRWIWKNRRLWKFVQLCICVFEEPLNIWVLCVWFDLLSVIQASRWPSSYQARKKAVGSSSGLTWQENPSHHVLELNSFHRCFPSGFVIYHTNSSWQNSAKNSYPLFPKAALLMKAEALMVTFWKVKAKSSYKRNLFSVLTLIFLFFP